MLAPHVQIQPWWAWIYPSTGALEFPLDLLMWVMLTLLGWINHELKDITLLFSKVFVNLGHMDFKHPEAFVKLSAAALESKKVLLLGKWLVVSFDLFSVKLIFPPFSQFPILSFIVPLLVLKICLSSFFVCFIIYEHFIILLRMLQPYMFP